MIYAIQWAFWIGLYYAASRVLLVASDVFVHEIDPAYREKYEVAGSWIQLYAMPVIGDFWLCMLPFTVSSKVMSRLATRMQEFRSKRAKRREDAEAVAERVRAIEEAKQHRLLRDLDAELKSEQLASWDAPRGNRK